MALGAGTPRRALTRIGKQTHRATNHQRNAFVTAAAISPAAPLNDLPYTHAPIQRYPPSKPPSYKPPELRKSQLHRQYISILHSSPLMLLFQHNNLTATEWAGIRRELAIALRKASAASGNVGAPFDPADSIRLQIIQTGIFAAALRVAEFYQPPPSASPVPEAPVSPHDQQTAELSHTLSAAAHSATLIKRRGKTSLKRRHRLHTLLSGPVALLTFPSVTPVHLAAALSILSPTPGSTSAFPAPRRRDAQGYYETPVQVGLQKLMLLGARVERRAMDGDNVRWIGGLAARGGLEGLRGEVVALLQGVGMGLVGGLQGVGTSIWGTLESRRHVMEEESKESKTDT